MLENISMDFVLDLFLVGLLLATIGYCALLNKRLTTMRDAHQELRKISEEFDKAIVRSKLGVEELKQVAGNAGQEIQSEINQAKELIEELQLINASSTRIADRLQQSVETTAKHTPVEPYDDDPMGLFAEKGDSADTSQKEEPKFRTDAEKELFEMLTKAT